MIFTRNSMSLCARRILCSRLAINHEKHHQRSRKTRFRSSLQLTRCKSSGAHGSPPFILWYSELLSTGSFFGQSFATCSQCRTGPYLNLQSANFNSSATQLLSTGSFSPSPKSVSDVSDCLVVSSSSANKRNLSIACLILQCLTVFASFSEIEVWCRVH